MGRGGFPGDAVVKRPPANARDMGSSHGPGRSHIAAERLSPCATTTEPASHNYGTHVPQLLKLACLEPMLHHNEKPTHRNQE